MQSIKLQSHSGPDGILKLEVPVNQSDADFEIMIIFQPVVNVNNSAKPAIVKSPEDLGWPVGYFEQTEGSLENDPIERPAQPEFEIREVLS